MNWIDWLLGKKQEPELLRPMTEEEYLDGIAGAIEIGEKFAQRNEQMMQAARERLRQRREQGQ